MSSPSTDPTRGMTAGDLGGTASRPGDRSYPARLGEALTASFGFFTPIVQPINLQPWENTAHPEDLARIVTKAESLGYSYVTVGDHAAIAAAESALYGSPRFFDPISTVGYLAALTSRIRFATHVYQIPLRSPLITAKAFATLDVLSRGRIIAGFGIGRREYESHAARVPFEHRGDIADDYLRAVLALWDGDPTTQHSQFVDIDDLVCLPRPVQRPRPPVWIGGDRLVGLRRAVRFGDAWTPWALTPDQVTATVARLAAAREEQLPLGFRIIVPLAPLGGRAPRGQPSAPSVEPGREATEKCIEQMARWREAGATEFLIDLPSRSLEALEDAMAWFAAEFIDHPAGVPAP
ncbi:TIGR03619 family F420-dependent LLM class oxidoreductase [Rhodococcus koreensis]